MKARTTKKPAARSESPLAAPPRIHADPTSHPGAESGEESEFLARAWAMEVEAVERYSMLADTMEEHNNPEVAELFRSEDPTKISTSERRQQHEFQSPGRRV